MDIRVNYSVALSIWILSSACGGAAGRSDIPDDPCASTANALLEQSPICDHSRFNDYRREVYAWKKRCKDDALSTMNNQLSSALSLSQKCIKETLSAKARKEECDKKLAVIKKDSECTHIGDCEELLTELSRIAALCETSVKDGFDKRNAANLETIILARMKQIQFTEANRTVVKKCNDAKTQLDKNKIDNALTELVSALAQMPRTAVPAGTTQAQADLDNEPMAQSVCADVLKQTMDIYLPQMTQALTDKKSEKDAIKWMANYRHLSSIRLRYEEVNGESLVPGTTSSMDALLLDVDKRKNRIERKAVADMIRINEATLVGGEARCKKLQKDLERIARKIKEHQAANNESKVAAYRTKLSEKRRELSGFIDALEDATANPPFEAKKTARLLQRILTAGCIPSEQSPQE